MNMNPGFGSWLIGMSLGVGDGMHGMVSGMFGMFIFLAATTFGLTARLRQQGGNDVPQAGGLAGEMELLSKV